MDDEIFLGLTEQNLAEIVPKLGPRMKILTRIKKHRLNSSIGSTSSNFSMSQGSSDIELSDMDSIGSATKKRKITCSPLEDLEDFLNSSSIGAVVLRAQRRFNYISSDQRNHLVRICIDRLIDTHGRLRNEHFEKLSENIVSLFPNESKGVYYIPPNSGKKMSNGKLVDRYRNVRRIITSSSKEDKEQEKEAEGGEVDTQLKTNLLFLQHNTEPWTKVLECWQTTLTLRKADLSEGTNLKAVFLKWPCLSTNLGWQLFERDFDMLYPDKLTTLIEIWDDMAPKLWDLVLRHRNSPLGASYNEAAGKYYCLHSSYCIFTLECWTPI